MYLWRFVMDDPTEVFHLAWGKNGLAVWHVCPLVDNEDGGSEAGHDVGTSRDKAQVTHSVVIDASEVNESIGCGDDTHVRTNDATVGAAV